MCKIRLFLLSSALLLIVLPSSAQTDDLDLPALGMNITTPSYYDFMIYFNDVTRHGSDWISHNPEERAVWDDERLLPLTTDGYPASLEADQAARMIVFLDSDIAPRGDYTLTWEGSGEISLVIDFGQPILFNNSAEKRQIVNVDPAEKELHLFVVITTTDPADPIRNVHLYLPGTDENSPRFTSWFLERLAPFNPIRFTDWNATNGTLSFISTWDERPQMNWASWGAEHSGFIGVPYEVQIELANTLGADMWVSVPHLADEEHVRNLAVLIRNNLHEDLRVWVEYSNEAWNPIFPVFDYLLQKAQQVALTEGLEDHYIYHQYGRQASEMLAVFEQTFAQQPDRLIGVLSGQAGYALPLQFAVDEATQQATLQFFDVVALAPYFGDTWETSVADLNTLVQEFYADELYTEEEFDAIFDSLEEGLALLFSGQGEYGEALFGNREIADSIGLPLVTYEGGQHLVAGYFGNDAPDYAYYAVNAHPRMYDIYQIYLDYWMDFGGETMTLFHLGGFWNESETFGMMQNPFQPIENAHKYRSALDWLAR